MSENKKDTSMNASESAQSENGSVKSVDSKTGATPTTTPTRPPARKPSKRQLADDDDEEEEDKMDTSETSKTQPKRKEPEPAAEPPPKKQRTESKPEPAKGPLKKEVKKEIKKEEVKKEEAKKEEAKKEAKKEEAKKEVKKDDAKKESKQEAQNESEKQEGTSDEARMISSEPNGDDDEDGKVSKSSVSKKDEDEDEADDAGEGSEDSESVVEDDDDDDDDDDDYDSKKRGSAKKGAKKTPVRKSTPKKATPAKKSSPKKSPTKKTPARSNKRKADDAELDDNEPNKKRRRKDSGSGNKKEKEAEETEEKEESGDEEEDDDEEEEETPKKKKPVKKEEKKPEKESEKKKRGGKKKKDEEEDDDKHKWWEEESDWRKGEKKNWKWRTLRHAGVYFPPPYVAHGIKMLYDGEEVELTPEQEEPVTYFVRYMDTDHYQKPQFSKNFFEDWKEMLGKKHKIKKFDKCDFTPIQKYVKDQQEKRKSRTKEEKEAEKKEKAQIKATYGNATVDGHKEAIGNFTVEPPGLFLGRGNHPKAGRIKQRVTPEQVTLNLDEKAEIPECPVEGHKWGTIVHNHEVTWLAAWRENINGQQKYVLFSAQSSIRGRSDRKKFETARELKKHISKIRKNYTEELTSDDTMKRQRATAMWVIDRLALRVGNDKGEDQADTVGCCSLRIEHVKLHAPKTIEFDFLGKDSMRYHNKVEVDQQVFDNFKAFMKKKKEGDEIFDKLNPPQLNAHLSSLMKGLTAKVFRTYNASNTMQQELEKWDPKKNKTTSVEEKILYFQRSSVQVAVLCNHQRSVPKTHSVQVEKLEASIKAAEDEIEEIQDHMKRIKDGKTPKSRGKTEDGEEKKPFPTSVESCEKKIAGLQERIRKTKIKLQEKEDLKEVSTSTSKVNYIDPRVSIAWCERNGIDVKKLFSKTLRDKFAWALEEVKKKPEFTF